MPVRATLLPPPLGRGPCRGGGGWQGRGRCRRRDPAAAGHRGRPARAGRAAPRAGSAGVTTSKLSHTPKPAVWPSSMARVTSSACGSSRSHASTGSSSASLPSSTSCRARAATKVLVSLRCRRCRRSAWGSRGRGRRCPRRGGCRRGQAPAATGWHRRRPHRCATGRGPPAAPPLHPDALGLVLACG